MKRSYFGIMPPLMFGARLAVEVILPAPVIDSSGVTAQPLFQKGGRLDISGLKITGDYTALQWQVLSGGSWVAVSGATSLNFGQVVNWSANQQLRLMAVNGNSEPAYSAIVNAKYAYLRIVSDTGGNTGEDMVTTGADDYNYSGKLISGYRYYSPRLIIDGADTGRAPGTAWTTSDASVAPISSVSGTGQLNTIVKAFTSPRTAVLTAKYQNLTSKLTLNG